MNRKKSIDFIAWLLFAIGMVALAMTWHSVEVQSFLEAVRSAK